MSEDAEPLHSWFELSYAQYLTIPQSVLQSMPIKWQQRFVRCLEELNGAIEWRPKDGRYWVRLKDGRGRFVEDPLMDYERGRRQLPLSGLLVDLPKTLKICTRRLLSCVSIVSDT
jgi:hypothetical protein